MVDRYLAVVNPKAGGGRCGKRAPDAVRELRAAGLEVTVRETRAPGDGTQLAREAYAQGVRHFISVGGDGTAFEVVNGLFPEAEGAATRPTLGFLPLGTGNSFLRDFAADGPAHAKHALLTGQRLPCDVVRLDHREGTVFYINLLSLGFVADVCTVTNRRFKPFGEAGYGLGVFVTVAGLRARPIPTRIDGGEQDRGDLVFLSINNSRFTGGKMMMAPRADPTDGRVDVIRVAKLGRLSLLSTFPHIFKGTHTGHPAVTEQTAKQIDFDVSEPLDAMIDGEVVRLWPTRLTVLHRALEVCA